MEEGLINDEQLRARITRFMQTDYVYYHDLAFRREELNELRELILDVSAVYNDHKYSVYKKMLADQLAFYIRS